MLATVIVNILASDIFASKVREIKYVFIFTNMFNFCVSIGNEIILSSSFIQETFY